MPKVIKLLNLYGFVLALFYLLFIINSFLWGCASFTNSFTNDQPKLDRHRFDLNLKKDSNVSESKDSLLSVNTTYLAYPVLTHAEGNLIIPATNLDRINLVYSRLAKEELYHKILDNLEEKTSSLQVNTKPCSPAIPLQADSCLVLSIIDYYERVGNLSNATKMASVSYKLELVSVDSKKVLWSDSFSFKDQTVLEDLVQANRGISSKGGNIGFATASSVLERALRNSFRKLDNHRTNQFLTK